MIFIHFSQSWHGKPFHRIVPILGNGVPRSGSIHRTNKRKNFWFAQGSWAAAVIGRCFIRNRDTTGRISRLRPT